MMPLISLFFIFRDRQNLPRCNFQFSTISLIVLATSILPLVIFFSGIFHQFSMVRLDLLLLSCILFVVCLHLLFFGQSIFLSYKFSWIILLLFLPIPARVLDYVIEFFRYGSAEVVDRLFSLLGMNYIRDSLSFHLPNISIYIAKECSGIRSSTALFITTLFAGQLMLRTVPSKVILTLFTPLLTILKNGIRITTLTVLADKVDTKWLTDSHLHHNGGIVFFGIILLLLFGILATIQKIEHKVLKKRRVHH